MEDRQTELDEREVGTEERSGPRFFSRSAAIGVLAGLLACSIAAAARGAPPDPVHGKIVLKGKALSFSRAWLVRGPDTLDEARPVAYVILSSRDLSEAIKTCSSIHCVLEAVKEGAVLEPLDDGRGSFWLRVVSSELPREEQLSGRRWIPVVDSRERLSGKLRFSYANTGDEADLSIDAPLVKEFPVRAER